MSRAPVKWVFRQLKVELASIMGIKSFNQVKKKIMQSSIRNICVSLLGTFVLSVGSFIKLKFYTADSVSLSFHNPAICLSDVAEESMDALLTS